jgi:hypothetical protein
MKEATGTSGIENLVEIIFKIIWRISAYETIVRLG